MDLKEIKKLVVLMNENGLCRIEVEEEGRRLLLEKPHHGAPPAAMAMPVPAGIAFPSVPSPGTAARAAAAPDESDGAVTFNSPMVGTFYRSPSPETPAFVKPGDRVGPESTLCLIEAMKVFNEIKAETSGTVEAILAKNGQAVEFGQPLFRIRPD